MSKREREVWHTICVACEKSVPVDDCVMTADGKAYHPECKP